MRVLAQVFPQKKENLNKATFARGRTLLLTKIILIFQKITFLVLDYLWPKKDLLIFCSKVKREPNQNVYKLFLEARKFGLCAFLVSDKTNPNSKYILNSSQFKTFFIVLRAKYVFLTHGPGDIPWAWFSSRKIITYVGHGIPLKGLMWANKSCSLLDKIIFGLEIPFYKYIVASSEEDQKRLSICFAKSPENVLVTGLPRNDNIEAIDPFLKTTFPGKRIILYAPTFRDNGSIKYFPFFDRDLKALDDFLDENDFIVLIRGHINERSRVEINNFKNIFEFSASIVSEIQSHLSSIDILITDYSSIYIDYLLLMRPILFFPYDQTEYAKNRGFLYNYDEVTPGPHIKSQHELIENLRNIEGYRKQFAEKYIRVKNLFHKYNDNQNSVRVLEAVLQKKLRSSIVSKNKFKI